MKWILTAGVAFILGTAAAGAQVPRGFGGDPPLRLTAGIGILIPETVFDGSSGSIWDFANTAIYRGSVEWKLSDQLSVGAALGRAKLPLLYSIRPGSPPSESGCSGEAQRCDATATLTHLMATVGVRPAGRGTLSQVLSLSAGVQTLTDFTEDATGRALAPLDGDSDFYVTVGLGVGIRLGRRVDLSLVQDAGYVMHQRAGLSGDRNAIHRVLITRLGLTYGFGRF